MHWLGSYTIANMMVGYHSPDEGYKDPNQCINYASCHDDFSLFDHLTYGVGSSNYPASTCAATAAIESAIMFSNGVAFIRGGEEIFQNKRVHPDEEATADPGRVVTINGERISSNSYNLSDYTNAFRWDRKISINGVSTKAYYDGIKDAVNARKNMKKWSKSELISNNPYSSTSEMNVWGQTDGSTIICMKNGKYFLFLSGTENNTIGFESANQYNNTIFISNPLSDAFTKSTNTITLRQYTCVCVTK